MKIWRLFFLLVMPACLCTACERNVSEMRDGYYTAQATSFDAEGWKEFVTIYVHSNKIITVDYNAKNSSGFLKSWDMDYMRRMKTGKGTYPNKYSRGYANALLYRQTPADVRSEPGAEDYLVSFRLLAAAAISRAKNGDTAIAYVAIPEPAAKQISGHTSL